MLSRPSSRGRTFAWGPVAQTCSSIENEHCLLMREVTVQTVTEVWVTITRQSGRGAENEVLQTIRSQVMHSGDVWWWLKHRWQGLASPADTATLKTVSPASQSLSTQGLSPQAVTATGSGVLQAGQEQPTPFDHCHVMSPHQTGQLLNWQYSSLKTFLHAYS